MIRFEQMKKDFEEDSWETETLITTFDLDEIETEIEIDYWVCFTVSRSELKFWTGKNVLEQESRDEDGRAGTSERLKVKSGRKRTVLLREP